MSAFYRVLLRLYPASYRADYAAELGRTYEENVRDRGRAGAMLAAVADVVPNALAVHREMLLQDLRYTARTLHNARGFALAAILVTALGVGANTAMFSVADFVLVRPLPYHNPDEIVRICEGPRVGGGWGCNNQMSPANWRDVGTTISSFASLGALIPIGANLVGIGDPVRASGARVTPEVLPLLGVRPLIGRTFDSTAADIRTVVIGYGLWQSRYAGDPGVLGKTLDLDATPHVVIGVMPDLFRFPFEDTQFWVPMNFTAAEFENRANRYIDGVARLRPGVTFEQARSEMDALAARLRQDYPVENREMGFSFFRQRDQMSPRYKTLLLALVGASLCMLLLTCANLASLLLARAAGRERELAVRAALGAGRERLIRQMLTESLMLALIGGVAGALLAALALPLLTQLVPRTLPIATEPTVDLRVFGFAAAFSALTGLGFGLLPALRVGGATGFAALREGTRGSARRSGLRATLVAIEVGVSVVLLISSGLLIRAMWRVEQVDPGFSTEHVLTLRTALPSQRYADSVRRAEFYRRVTAEVRALPGVQSAAYTSGLPLVLGGGLTRIVLAGDVERRNDDRQNASMRLVTPQFFDALGIPLKSGRDVADTDTPDRQLVAVISESFAEQWWPGQDPIGHVFTTRGQLRTVVGVVGNIRVRGLERSSEPQLYLPANQPPVPVGELYQPKDLVVRSARQDPSLAAAIRDVVRRVDPQQPVSNVRMLSDVVGDQTATRRAQLNVLGALALLALLLTAVGIHGLLAFTVAQRDREIGVRLALGADPGSVARMVMSEGVRIAFLGVIPGVVVAYIAARGMSTMLFGVEPHDPLTISVVAIVCFATTVAACARPALRAAATHPMSALRSD